MNKSLIHKLFRNRKLVIQVCLTYLKYSTLRLLQDSGAFLRFIEKKGIRAQSYNNDFKNMQPKQILLRQINTALRHLRLDSNCLINSLVKRDILMKSGYSETIVVGIRKENEMIRAHAWLSCENAVYYHETRRL
jgi:hypothetical protein